MDPTNSFVRSTYTPSPRRSMNSRTTGAVVGVVVLVILCIMFAGWWFWPSSYSCGGCGDSSCSCNQDVQCSCGSDSCGCNCSGCGASSGTKKPSGSTENLMHGVRGPIRGHPHDWEKHEGARLLTNNHYQIHQHQTAAVNALHSSVSDRWTGTDPRQTLRDLTEDLVFHPSSNHHVPLSSGTGPSKPISTENSFNIAEKKKTSFGSNIYMLGPNDTSEPLKNAMSSKNTLTSVISHRCPHCVNFKNSALNTKHDYDNVVMADVETHGKEFCRIAGCDHTKLGVPAVWNGSELKQGFNNSSSLNQYNK